MKSANASSVMTDEAMKLLYLGVTKGDEAVVRGVFAQYPGAYCAHYANGGGTDYSSLCVTQGFLTGIEIAVEHGLHVDSKVTCRGIHTPLIHCAISSHKPAFVKWLIEKGADLSVKNEHGSTVLPACVSRTKYKLSDPSTDDYLAVLELLVRRNAPWETELYTMRHPMPTICRLHSAWEDTNADILKIAVIGSGVGWDIDATDLIEDPDGRVKPRSGLLASIITGQKPLALKLLELGARLDNVEEWARTAAPNDDALRTYHQWQPDILAAVMRRQLAAVPSETQPAPSRRRLMVF